jgi:hypothetical protein
MPARTNRRMDHHAASELAAPSIGRYGRPDAHSVFIVTAVVVRPRCRRVTTAFIALVTGRSR